MNYHKLPDGTDIPPEGVMMDTASGGKIRIIAYDLSRNQAISTIGIFPWSNIRHVERKPHYTQHTMESFEPGWLMNRHTGFRYWPMKIVQGGVFVAFYDGRETKMELQTWETLLENFKIEKDGVWVPCGRAQYG